jgi:hypothetical protein
VLGVLTLTATAGGILLVALLAFVRMLTAGHVQKFKAHTVRT